MTRLPDFVVLGQGKAGTSLIYRTLAHYGDIGLSEPKELHYFTANAHLGPDWYARAFAHLPADIPLIGEISPSYLAPEVIPQLAETLGPETKVIFVLRRPIERAYSRYLQNLCARQQGPAFKRFAARLPERMTEMLEAIRLCYEHFGPDRVLPLFYETDITGAHPDFENRLLPFLGLEPAAYAEDILAEGVPNPGVMPRYLYSGENALHIRSGPSVYILPPNVLAFCGQLRNTTYWTDPTAQEVAEAFARQSRWSTEVPPEEYRMMLRNAVRPTADQLEAEFGYDMSHWRLHPQRISYAPAPPPWQFRKKKKKRAVS